MKKILFIAALAIGGGSLHSYAQSNILNTVANASGAIKTVQQISNVASAAKEISGTLTKTLGLTSLQNTKLLSVFTKHITGTNGIASLAKSNVTSYATKLLGLNTGTLNSLKTIMTAAQYAKLLGLGPKSGSTGGSLLNALSGGNNLSTGAMSVLSSLLMK